MDLKAGPKVVASLVFNRPVELCVTPMQPFSGNRGVRSVICKMLAFLVLVGGTLNTPGTVLCVGPGNHCHLEVVVGASCNDDLLGLHGSAPRARDGCPRGSKDFRLSVDSHRTDARPVIAVPAALFVASSLVESSPPSRSSSSGFPITRGSLYSAIVLRC